MRLLHVLLSKFAVACPVASRQDSTKADLKQSCDTVLFLRNFKEEIGRWRGSHPREKKKYLLLFWRFAGALERGQHGKFLISELPYVMTSPCGRPPAESMNDVKSSRLLERTVPKAKIFADGNKAWKSHAESMKRRCFQVRHVKMEFTRKARGHKTHGTQCIDRKWSALKRYIPKELSTKTKDGALNPQLNEYIYSYVWRCNTPQGQQLKELGALARKCLKD